MLLHNAVLACMGGAPDRSPLYDMINLSGPGGARQVRNNLPWEADYGGWGGRLHFRTYSDRPTPVWTLYDRCEVPPTRCVERTPVVFVHGQGRTATDWEEHADYFREQGYSGDELWAITFRHSVSTHAEMATQLDSFISRVRSYTGRDTVHIVAHSLGVTGVRYWLHTRERHDWVNAFISIGGANHGIPILDSIPQAFFSERQHQVLQFLNPSRTSPGELQLSELNENGPHPDITYYTIRGKYDPVFLGDRESPRIDGATANIVLPKNHDGIRNSTESIRLIYNWLADN